MGTSNWSHEWGQDKFQSFLSISLLFLQSKSHSVKLRIIIFSCSYMEAAFLLEAIIVIQTNPSCHARTTLNQRIIDWAMVAYHYCAMLRGAHHKMALGFMLTALSDVFISTLKRAQEVKNLTDGPTGEFRVKASG